MSFFHLAIYKVGPTLYIIRFHPTNIYNYSLKDIISVMFLVKKHVLMTSEIFSI